MTVPAAGLRVTPSLSLVRELGRGGMGAVWVAEHHALKREVAVKLLDPERRASAAAVQRFEREAASVARVKSPHVVSVQDAGVSPELGPFLVMELLVGRDLASVLEDEGPLALPRIANVVEHVARGLAKAHEAGLVHRDVKAENVFLCHEPGEPELAKVLDFGIALGDDDRLTEVGVAIGSRLSMSPEQAAGKPVDARSDAYALALLAYRMLTGSQAISRASLDALGLAAYRAERPRPSALREGVPPAVDAWFSRATEPDPAARFTDVRAMAAAFLAALEGGEPAPAQDRDATRDVTRDEAEPADPRERTADAGEPRPTPIPPARVGDRTDEPLALAAPAAPVAVRRRRLAGAVAAIVALSVAGLVGARALGGHEAGGATPPASSAPAPSAAPSPLTALHLTLVMDVSGTNRKRGLALDRAARLAAAMITEAGGVRGRPVVVDTIDDQGDEATFLRARVGEAIARSEARVFFGPLLTVQTAPARALARERGMLEISASATGAALGAGEGFLGLAPSDDLQALRLAERLRGGGGPAVNAPARACRRVGVVAASDAHGEPFARALEGELARAPRIPSNLVPVDPAPRRTYEAEVARALAGEADCLVLLVSPKLGARVLLSVPPPVRARVRAFAGDSLASNDFLEFGRGDVDDTSSPTVAEGVSGVAVGTAPAGSPEYRTFVRRYQELFHAEPDEPFAARQFDAVVLAALGLERAGLTATAAELHAATLAATRGKHGYGPSELGRLLHAVARGEDVDYEGASGDLTFGADGRVTGPFDAWTVSGGKLVRTPLPR